MRRFLPKTLNQWLLLAAALAVFGGWLANWLLAGVAVALVALCVLAIRNPRTDFLGRLPLLGRLLRRRAEQAGPVEEKRPALAAPPPRQHAHKDKNMPLVEQMIAQGRVALLLRPQIASSLSAADLERAQAALDEAMAIVPQGSVVVRARCYDTLEEEAAERAQRLVHVEGLFLDRYAVSNHDYFQFVEDGGYEQMSLWDETIWPAVLGFVDRTGQPGPRFWENGAFPDGLEDHPVVGVSWYEACAYARWAGKRLPTDPEWVKTGAWPVSAEGGKPVQRRFPWGDGLDRKRANLWGSGCETTLPVHALPAGASVNGVHQLIGNVWEWTSSAFSAWEPAGRKIETTLPLKSIRGGAFDTYFDAQAHCQFQSGESPLTRKHNIGFRCALGFCDVAHAASDAAAEPETEAPATPREEVLT